jgi:hypothetical protein
MLQIPRTIRDIDEDDVPNNSSAIEQTKAKLSAKIVEGFKLFQNEEKSESPFVFGAEINIDNPRLWDLFISLSGELPETVALLFGFYDNDINYGKYTYKNEIILELSKYKREITEDCHLELGLIHHTKLEVIEIFIAESKYIKFWGIDEKSFRSIMNEFDLHEINDIEFIDEYPKVVYPLKTIIEDVTDTFDIISDFKDKFLD